MYQQQTCNIHCSISILGSTSVADILHKLVSERDFNKVFQNSFSMAYESGNFFISEPCLCLWRFERFDHDALFTTFIIPSLCLVSTLFFLSLWLLIFVYFIQTYFFFVKLKHKSSHSNRFVIKMTFELLENTIKNKFY